MYETTENEIHGNDTWQLSTTKNEINNKTKYNSKYSIWHLSKCVKHWKTIKMTKKQIRIIIVSIIC